MCETIKFGVSLIRQLLQKDFKDVWWVYNLSQDLVITRRDVLSKRLSVIRVELPPHCKVNQDYASVCKH